MHGMSSRGRWGYGAISMWEKRNVDEAISPLKLQPKSQPKDQS